MTEELTSERETWDRACQKVKDYQIAHKIMDIEECLKWKESEQKSEARRVD